MSILDFEDENYNPCYFCNAHSEKWSNKVDHHICDKCLSNYCNFCEEPKNPEIKLMDGEKMLRQTCSYEEMQFLLMGEHF